MKDLPNVRRCSKMPFAAFRPVGGNVLVKFHGLRQILENIKIGKGKTFPPRNTRLRPEMLATDHIQA